MRRGLENSFIVRLRSQLTQPLRGCSSMAERQLPKLRTRVRFPSPAPTTQTINACHPTSVAKAQMVATKPIATINRLRPIGARASSLSARGSSRGLNMANPLPTTRAAPSASSRIGIKSGPRNIFLAVMPDLGSGSCWRTSCNC